MTREPVELTEARELLSKFAVEVCSREGIGHLAKALSLLVDVRDADESGKYSQVASNLVLAYARKIRGEIHSLLLAPCVHSETVDHWQKVVATFEQAGFRLPQELEEVRSKLLMIKLTREINLMSPLERERLVKKLQAMTN